MGLNIGLNSLTAGGLFLTTVILLLMGILLYTASKKVEENEDFESNEKLEKINSNLKTAYILIFIGAGLTLIVTIAYAGHEVYWTPSEWLHAFIYFVDIVVVIIGGVYAYGALNDLNVPELEQSHNGADGYIWASLLLGLFTLMGLIVTGSARVGYHTVREETRKRLGEAEVKLHQVHDKVVGAGRELLNDVTRNHSMVQHVQSNDSYNPVPVNSYNPVPVNSYNPVPVNSYNSVPVNSYNPVPVNSYPVPSNSYPVPSNSYNYDSSSMRSPSPSMVNTRITTPNETITINDVPNLNPINIRNANMSTDIDLKQPLPLIRPSNTRSYNDLESMPISNIANRPLRQMGSLDIPSSYIPLSRNTNL